MDIHRTDFEQNNGKPVFKIFKQMDKVRTKLTYSCCLYFAFFMSGWVNRQFGPSLLDIQQITRVSFTIASTYLTAWQVGCIVGCFMSGYLQGRVHSSVLLCFTSVGSATFMTWLPWSTNAVETYAIYLFIGICMGNNDSIVVAEQSALWGDSVSVIMQITFMCYTLGGSLSVFLTAPFLLKTIENHQPSSNRSYELDTQHHFHSKLYIPFSFTATLAVIVAVIFLIVICKRRKGFVIEYVDINVRSSGKVKNVKQKAIALVILGIIMALSATVIFNMGSFLTSFLVKLSVSSRSDAASITSLFTVFQAVGRISGIATVQFVDHFSLLIGHSAICLVGFIGIWNCVIYKTSILTLCFSVAITGFGFSIMDATLKSWVEKNFFPVTGVVSSFFLISKRIGNIMSSIAIGYSVDKYSEFSFLYITIGELLLFVVFIYIANCFRIAIITL